MKLLAVALALSAFTAAAQTTRVGNETKPTTGTVTAMESGDIACYLTMTNERGEEITEMADFDICEQTSLIGKRVSLTWTIADVMSHECEGDPDCTKTRKAAIVSGAKALPRAATRPATASQTSLCTPAETTVFACATGKKVVSVCASQNATRTRGTLEYRFGKPGEPLELALPARGKSASDAATGDSVGYSGGGAAWLRFRSGAFAYAVYTAIGRWGRNGETLEKSGVVVEKNGTRVATLPCTTAPVSLLGGEWFERAGIPSDGEELDIP